MGQEVIGTKRRTLCGPDFIKRLYPIVWNTRRDSRFICVAVNCTVHCLPARVTSQDAQ